MMIPAIVLGRKDSVGFPGKNMYTVGGKPLSYYCIAAAQNARYVDAVYVSTDCPAIERLAIGMGARVIVRPAELCSDSALCEDAYAHALQTIQSQANNVELLVLLFCNAPTILPTTIDEAIGILRWNETLDSVVTVSKYNMWSPLRTRQISEAGLLEPFVPLDAIGDVNSFSSDRDSQGDAYFADMGASIVRPRCLSNIATGKLPQKWMGQRIFPLIQWGGCDVDYEWQIPQVEFWLKEHGLIEQDSTQRSYQWRD